jgi:hypothetical protein
MAASLACNPMEKSMTKYRTAALALAGVLALTAASVTDASAQWRRHQHGWGPGVGIAAGVAAGALIGSAVAARPYGYYGAPGYYAEPGYYEAPVAGYYYDDTQSRSPSRNWGYRYNCGGSYGQGRDCSEGDTGR